MPSAMATATHRVHLAFRSRATVREMRIKSYMDEVNICRLFHSVSSKTYAIRDRGRLNFLKK